MPYVKYLQTLTNLLKKSETNNSQRKILNEIRQKQMEMDKIQEQIENLLWNSDNLENDQEKKLELNIHLNNCRTFISITEQMIKQFKI